MVYLLRAEHHSSDHDLQAGQKSSINAAQALAAVNAVSEALVCGAELKGAPKTSVIKKNHILKHPNEHQKSTANKITTF